ncbi:MAG: hypothetical protein EAX81_08670 [Candidatus Thorarchaeota archaeon]|nr:hypothetical protein [Candidatus Thorarchaeota archaeon]
MQSLVLTKDGFQIADTPMPPVMPGDVRIEIRAVGICGTDLAIWKGEYEVELPLVLGHEIVGVVHQSSVQDIDPGTLVTTETDVPCHRCWYCRHSDRRHCVDKEVLGVTTDGGLSEYLSVPAELVHPLPLGVEESEGTFVEPLASALQTMKYMPPEPDEKVLVLGSGKLGLLVAQVYDAHGAEAILVGRNRWQLGLGRQLGLKNTINAAEKDWKQAVLDVTSGVGPRLVVETTGNPDGLKMALDIVRSNGSVALKSMHGLPVEINPTDIVQHEISLFGSSCGPFKKAIDMLAKGRIEVKRLVTKKFKLEDATKAFEFADQPATTKVIINI